VCPHKLPGRLLESVSDYRSRWMVISLAIVRQNPAYRATLLYNNAMKSMTCNQLENSNVKYLTDLLVKLSE
jgi:hypothetical protein